MQPGTMKQPNSILEQAREAYRQGDWARAFDILSSIDSESSLQPVDLEMLAKVAYMNVRTLTALTAGPGLIRNTYAPMI